MRCRKKPGHKEDDRGPCWPRNRTCRSNIRATVTNFKRQRGGADGGKVSPIPLEPGWGFWLSKRNSLTLQNSLTISTVSSLLLLCDAQEDPNRMTCKKFSKKQNKQLGDSSGGKAFPAYAWEPKFHPQDPCKKKKARCVDWPCNPSTERWWQVDHWGLLANPNHVIRKFQVLMRGPVKQSGQLLRYNAKVNLWPPQKHVYLYTSMHTHRHRNRTKGGGCHSGRVHKSLQ